jgi:hypothetical protein
MQLNDFINLIIDWDITHQFSDDPSVYNRGHEHYTNMLAIYNSLNQLDKETAALIANMHVDTKIIESDRAQYYWK